MKEFFVSYLIFDCKIGRSIFFGDVTVEVGSDLRGKELVAEFKTRIFIELSHSTNSGEQDMIMEQGNRIIIQNFILLD